jgi:hypothetical protein
MRNIHLAFAALLAIVCLSLPAAAQVVGPSPVFLYDRGTSGSITSTGLCPGTSCITGQAPGTATLTIGVTGTWVATLAFQGSFDGVNFFAVPAYPQAGGAPVLATAANGNFYVAYAGLNAIRVNATAYTSGTAAVTMEASAMTLFTQSVPTASATLGGASLFTNAAVTTAVQVKATQGQVYSLHVGNTTAAVAYLQFFCKPSASVTLGTTGPDASFMLAASASIDPSLPTGICSGGTGITVAGTTTATGSTGAALAVVAAYQ